MSEEEIWKTCLNARSYEVSSLGRVRRRISGPRTRVGLILIQQVDAYGSPVLNISVEGKKLTTKVNRLVCEAFCGPAPIGAKDVIHDDACRSNNNAANLRWGTRTESNQNRKRHGRDRTRRGSAHSNAKLTEADVEVIRSAARRPGLLDELAATYGVKRNVIGNIRSRTAGIWAHVPFPGKKN